jgi:hypothetical protein
MRLSLSAATAAIVLSSAALSSAATVTSVAGIPYVPNWSTHGTSTGSVSITNDQPRSGNGSLRLETNASNKAAATYGGDRFFTVSTLGTFGDLLNGGSLGFEFFRDAASTTNPHLAPALEISFSNGSNLKWEAVYNGYPVASPVNEGQWYSINLDANTGTFYQFKSGGVVTSGGSQQNLTLAQWLASSLGNDFTESTAINGISVQAGSGWANNFTGYVDNVYLNFGSGTGSISANFETPGAPVPTPAAAAAGLSLLTLVASRRALSRNRA